jgi:LysM repeat protein
MNRNEENEQELRGSPADERVERKPRAAAETGAVDQRPRPPARPQTRLRSTSLQTTSSEPWVPATLPRRGPTHPDWEKPPTQYDYPHLRGRDSHRTMWPLIAAALAAILVIGVLVIIPAVLGHGGSAVASASATPTASGSASLLPSGSPCSTACASPSESATPVPSFNYTNYTVVSGDSLAKIVKKYPGVTRAQILAANPQLKAPNYPVLIGQVLKIPQIGPGSPSPTDSSASPTTSPGAS